jgi:hypothetical protein
MEDAKTDAGSSELEWGYKINQKMEDDCIYEMHY